MQLPVNAAWEVTKKDVFTLTNTTTDHNLSDSFVVVDVWLILSHVVEKVFRLLNSTALRNEDETAQRWRCKMST